MSKKTEKIEVRLSPELKAQLSAFSKQKGQAISQTIRDAVMQEIQLDETHITGAPAMFRRIFKSYLKPSLAAFSATALSVIMLSSLSQPALAQASLRISFAELDRNQDGIIDKAEYESDFLGEVALDQLGEIELDFAMPKACEVDFAKADFAENLSGENVDDIFEGSAFDFENLDGNADKKINFKEFRTFERAVRKDQFFEIDLDGDKKISIAEFTRADAIIYDGEIFSETDDVNLSEACELALLPKHSQMSEDELGALTDEAIIAYQREDFAGMDANMDKNISLKEYLNH